MLIHISVWREPVYLALHDTSSNEVNCIQNFRCECCTCLHLHSKPQSHQLERMQEPQDCSPMNSQTVAFRETLFKKFLMTMTNTGSPSDAVLPIPVGTWHLYSIALSSLQRPDVYTTSYSFKYSVHICMTSHAYVKTNIWRKCIEVKSFHLKYI